MVAQKIGERHGVGHVGRSDRDEVPDARAARRHGLHLVRELRVEHQNLAVGLVQHVLELVRGVQDRDVHEDEARPGGAEEDDAVFGKIARHDGDLRALGPSGADERVREPVRRGIELGVAQPDIVADDRRLVRKALRRAPQHVSGQHPPLLRARREWPIVHAGGSATLLQIKSRKRSSRLRVGPRHGAQQWRRWLRSRARRAKV